MFIHTVHTTCWLLVITQLSLWFNVLFIITVMFPVIKFTFVFLIACCSLCAFIDLIVCNIAHSG